MLLICFFAFSIIDGISVESTLKIKDILSLVENIFNNLEFSNQIVRYSHRSALFVLEVPVIIFQY